VESLGLVKSFCRTFVKSLPVPVPAITDIFGAIWARLPWVMLLVLRKAWTH
jgi:hypothetical protein